MGDGQQPTMGEIFDTVYRGMGSSAVYRRTQRAVYGGEYPDEVAPYSFATRSELGRIARELGVASGRRIVDLGCGEGGAGLWVARETGASLIGVDVSPVAIARARERIPHFGCEGRADFAVGDFVATGLPAGSCDGAMSIDVLWVVPDKMAALREVARILRPGARFVFTTWDFAASPPGEPQVADHRPLLRDAGFATEAYERTEHWERDFRAVVAGLERAREDLAAEIGPADTDALIAQMRRRATLLPGWQRVFIVARRS